MMFPNPSPEEISYVCNNLRPKSHEDIFGATFDNLDELKAVMTGIGGIQWVGYCDKLPAAIVGAHLIHGGVWGVYGFGTAKWGDIWRDVTKVGRREVLGGIQRAGGHRAQCVSPAEHKDTHAWLRLLGATIETPMPKYGRNGEDYVMLAWVKED